MEKREEKKIPFLVNGVPNLGLDDLIINTNAMSSEFDTNCGLGFEIELGGSETGEGIRLTKEERKALG